MKRRKGMEKIQDVLKRSTFYNLRFRICLSF